MATHVKTQQNTHALQIHSHTHTLRHKTETRTSALTLYNDDDDCKG